MIPLGPQSVKLRDMNLSETFHWQGRMVRWGSDGTGPALVFRHGTPWSSALWEPFADTLSAEFAVHAWDMPGYVTRTCPGAVQPAAFSS